MSGSLNISARQQLRAPAWDGGEKWEKWDWHQQPQVQTLNLRIMECMQLEAFPLGGMGSQPFPQCWHLPIVDPVSPDLTHARTHFTLQCLSSLSCDLSRAKAAPASTGLVPEMDCVCSELALSRRGDCPVWGASVFAEESEPVLVPPRPQRWGKVFLLFPGLKTSPAMSSEGICLAFAWGPALERQ